MAILTERTQRLFRNALVEAENSELRQENDRLRETIRLRDETILAERERNSDLRAAMAQIHKLSTPEIGTASVEIVFAGMDSVQALREMQQIHDSQPNFMRRNKIKGK